jgi:hypothetical protein
MYITNSGYRAFEASSLNCERGHNRDPRIRALPWTSLTVSIDSRRRRRSAVNMPATDRRAAVSKS